MDQRDVVVVLTVLGAALTIGGVLLGYGRALVAKKHLDELGEFNSAFEDDFLEDAYRLGLTGTQSEVQSAEAARQWRDDAIAHEVTRAGFDESAPTFADLRLPITYWSKRGALNEALSDFWVGGLIALSGVLISTVAAVWSVYLPPAGSG